MVRTDTNMVGARESKAIWDSPQGIHMTHSTHCMLEKRAASLLEAPAHPNLAAAHPREKSWLEERSDAALSRPSTWSLDKGYGGYKH